MAASNAQAQNKKIKPINHPNLVLKTPIAYHGGSDLSVLPIDKDGIAVCEKCGAIGVKHAFYTRQRKFCSVTCARSYTGYCNSQKNSDDGSGAIGIAGEDKVDNIKYYYKKQVNYKFKLMDTSEHLVGMIPMEPLPRLPGLWHAALDEAAAPPPPRSTHLMQSYRWNEPELFSCNFLAAPVRLFSHAPLSDMWDNVFEGMKVEVQNTDTDSLSPKLSDYFWVATVLKLKGYMGLLRYEGFGNDDSKDFWVNLMNWEVHAVGWCATRGKPLIPPHTIENKYSDWKTFLVRQLTGARTLPTDFYNKIYDGLKSRFRHGHILEVLDKEKLSQVKVATVDDIVEKRLYLRYFDSKPDNVNGFWCHEDSPLIHPVGWARMVQHTLVAPSSYLQRLNSGIPHPDDTTPDMFKYYNTVDPHNINFRPHFVEGMKVEAIDPLNLSAICQATVMKVLQHGYIMIRIDYYNADEVGAELFCYHENSPCVFPSGFCKERGLPLTITLGQVHPPPPPQRPPSVLPPHGFVTGMRLECVDLMEPRLICVATIVRVAGRLLRVHFDGWGDEYDQWLDCESTDIFPVGWCRAVGHRLEAPHNPAAPSKPKAQLTKRGGRKKKAKMQTDTKHPEPSGNSNGSNGSHLDTMPSELSELADDQAMPDLEYDIKDEIKNEIKQEITDVMSSNLDMHESMSHVLRGDMDMDIKQDIDKVIEQETARLAAFDDILDGNDMGFDLMDKSCDDEPLEGADNPMDISVEQMEMEPVAPIKEEVKKSIPRLVGSSFEDRNLLNIVEPETWDVKDVAEFLATNDCAPYSVHFSQVDGKRMLDLTKDQIIELLEMKVGPSLKIFDLIQQLKCKLIPAQARLKLYNKS